MKLGKFELDKVYCGDSKELTKGIPDNSIDLIVTDPPYQLSSIQKRFGKEGSAEAKWGKDGSFRRVSKGFMGKEWDVLPPIEVWQESLRILKHGAFAFIMTTPRQDSLCQILMDLTNAGFNMGFSSIYWTYASGFPKASNIGLMVDKRECKKQLTEKLGRKPTKEEFKKEWEGFREIVGESWNAPNLRDVGHKSKEAIGIDKLSFGQVSNADRLNVKITKATSEQAKSLNGSYGGFQPKPAVEVIIVAMKPLSEKTYVDQALKNRKGITWLDDGRIPYESDDNIIAKNPHTKSKGSEAYNNICYGKYNPVEIPIDYTKQKGRFPANLLVSDDVLNDGKTLRSGGRTGLKHSPEIFGNAKSNIGKTIELNPYQDSGSFSRYFDLDNWAVSQGVKDTFPFIVCAKASKSEKNKGLENLEEGKEPFKERLTAQCKICGNKGLKLGAGKQLTCGHTEIEYVKTDYKKRGNIHPTVKPIKLMSYLITLGSREGDIILDNFCGSGSTLISAKLLNRRFLGFDTEMEYVEISRARLSAIKHVQESLL